MEGTASDNFFILLLLLTAPTKTVQHKWLSRKEWIRSAQLWRSKRGGLIRFWSVSHLFFFSLFESSFAIKRGINIRFISGLVVNTPIILSVPCLIFLFVCFFLTGKFKILTPDQQKLLHFLHFSLLNEHFDSGVKRRTIRSVNRNRSPP